MNTDVTPKANLNLNPDPDMEAMIRIDHPHQTHEEKERAALAAEEKAREEALKAEKAREEALKVELEQEEEDDEDEFFDSEEGPSRASWRRIKDKHINKENSEAFADSQDALLADVGPTVVPPDVSGPRHMIRDMFATRSMVATEPLEKADRAFFKTIVQAREAPKKEEEELIVYMEDLVPDVEAKAFNVVNAVNDVATSIYRGHISSEGMRLELVNPGLPPKGGCVDSFIAAVDHIQKHAILKPKHVPGGEELMDGEMLADMLMALVSGCNDTKIDIASAAAMIKNSAMHRVMDTVRVDLDAAVERLDEKLPMRIQDLENVFNMHIEAHRDRFNTRVSELGLTDSSQLAEHWGMLREVRLTN